MSNPLSLEPLARQLKAVQAEFPQMRKYQHLSEAFATCIRSGDYGPGRKLPGETEISAALPVGLSTVQKALAQLTQEGLIVRRRKIGSFVADRNRQVPEVHVYRFRDPKTGEQMLPFTRVLDMQPVQTADYGPLLVEFGEEQVMRIDRLVWVSGAQPAFSAFFMRIEHTLNLPESPDVLHGASYHRLLWEQFGIRTDSVRHCVSAGLLSRRACEYLDLAAPHVGMVWSAYEHDRDQKLQIVQRFELPQSHRPMEVLEGKLSL